ncbi:MAG: alcohol dehydrogenase catalytic domain-containing protein [Spirochaetales bacterium]|jgi:2-desacetyl-2-hydroxyethyl bacteriochlorophyllide A dehydrogenase|nr:alcohol dehydrogenase catalytic domain-containing protein [Spirochaetales bacterium]
MKAIRIAELGNPVVEAQLPIPVCNEDDVLIRIKAAGICHSDEHYRSGIAPPAQLPITPGHEIAGTIESTGSNISSRRVGESVAVHYMRFCGVCSYCTSGNEQFCGKAEMIGKNTDGGWAEYITVPSVNAVRMPESIDFKTGAVMMCSTATSFHALKKSRMLPGESVAVFGVGGLGMSAIQLAYILGAEEVFAVDINKGRLEKANSLGAVAVNPAVADPVEQIMAQTDGTGVDVALELIGLKTTIEQAVSVLANMGRAAVAGICKVPISVDSYSQLVGKEGEIIGVSDHHLSEITEIFEFASKGKLDYSNIVTESLALDADEINNVLKRLGAHGDGVRSLICP